MSQEQTKTKTQSRKLPIPTQLTNSHYTILGLHPCASVLEIRRAYRELSKLYHPDTTDLPSEVAKAKFQRLNEAYAVLCNPERRSLYDLKIGYSRWNVIQPPPDPSPQTQQQWSRSAYLDPSDRPLSAGEVFALFIMGLTLVGCLLLAILIAVFRGDQLIPPSAIPDSLSIINCNLPFLSYL